MLANTVFGSSQCCSGPKYRLTFRGDFRMMGGKQISLKWNVVNSIYSHLFSTWRETQNTISLERCFNIFSWISFQVWHIFIRSKLYTTISKPPIVSLVILIALIPCFAETRWALTDFGFSMHVEPGQLRASSKAQINTRTEIYAILKALEALYLDMNPRYEIRLVYIRPK